MEAFGESSINFRLMIKTRPGKQWETACKIWRRIKRRFETDGIEIPLPQRIVPHVHVDEPIPVLDENQVGRYGG